MQAQSIEFLQLFNGQVQYVVPRWQRRYRWGKSDIERLVDDLLTVASQNSNLTHYGGTLLTFPEPGPAGVVKSIRVVDGQQRLTTVSILLACIAENLGDTGHCGDWTAENIYDDLLTNPKKSLDKRLKLKLQDGDEEEYRQGLEGEPKGVGAVAQAWKVSRQLVERNNVDLLLKGLSKLKVVSIGVEHEDPQQIFESLNATGRPLTESEKVKNWLLMGLPDAEQQNLHDNYWLKIEEDLDAKYSTESIDKFLRDFLRWQTGEVRGINLTYEDLRRWAVRKGMANERPALCQELARLANMYGILTGTAGKHHNGEVERELRHLRAIGIDVHRPLTLRLLDDASKLRYKEMPYEDGLVKIFAGIGSWITRLWLADKQTAGMNTAIAEIAHDRGPDERDDFADYWLNQISKRQNTRVGVPHDGEVRNGIQNRKAYGGSATKSSFAVLYALAEHEHREETPSPDRLTIEHVMPQKLTSEWRLALGDNADEIHKRYVNCLSNLTLSGDYANPEMGAKPFSQKIPVYKRSTIGITQRLAKEDDWNERTLDKRYEDLAHRALKRWPWHRQEATEDEKRHFASGLRWRFESGPWRSEDVASQMVLNVAGALLTHESTNAEKLSGKAIIPNIHLASVYPPESKVGSLTMRAIPGHEQYVIYPYARDYPTSAKRCRELGRRCGVSIDVEVSEKSEHQAFWRLLKETTKGLPGQKDTWRGPSQWTTSPNSSGDCVGIHIGNPELIWLYVRAGDSQQSQARSERMKRYSWLIKNQMGDQTLGNDMEKNSEKGWSITVQKNWIHNDEDSWPEVADWIKQQHERLQMIVKSFTL